MFKTKSKTKDLYDKDEKVNVSTWQKLKLLFNICPDPRLYRFLYKGIKKLNKDFDILKMHLDIRKLKQIEIRKQTLIDDYDVKPIDLDEDSDDNTLLTIIKMKTKEQ